MSAYALPGLVFPPTPTEYFNNNFEKNGNCHQQSLSHNPSLGSPDINASLKGNSCSSEEKVDYSFYTCNDSIRNRDNDSDDVEVYVNGAQVDILQFVTATCSESNKVCRQPKTSKKRICTDPIRSGRRQRLTQRVKKNSASSPMSITDDSKLSQPCPRESSIQFEVTISYRDRTYEGIHSLSRIRQLHQELVENALEEDECSDENNRESMSLKRSSCELNPAIDLRPQSTRSYGTRSRIPDLPSIFYENNATITNFRHLYAQIHQCYAPAIESWLRKLFKVLIPAENPILAYFLCESIMLNSCQDNKQSQPTLSRKSPSFGSQLEIITEEGIASEERKVGDDKEHE